MTASAGQGANVSPCSGPPLLSNTRQEQHLCYVWNGLQIVTVYEKREFGNDG